MDLANSDEPLRPQAPAASPDRWVDGATVAAGVALAVWLLAEGQSSPLSLVAPVLLVAVGWWNRGRAAALTRRLSGRAVAAEAALARSRQRAEDFADASPNWFWETGADGRYRFLSPRLGEILGDDPAAVIGDSLFDLGDLVEDADTWAEFRGDIEARKPFHDLELSVRSADGESLILRLGGKPVVDADGIFRGYRGCGFDMTAETLALVEARFMQAVMHDALESISEGFVLFDADGRLLVCNERYRQAYPNIADLLTPGTGFAEILRAAAERGGYEGEGDLGSWVEDRLKRHLRHSRPVDGLLSDGRWYRISEHATGSGGVVKILMDITELKRREEELAGQTARLELTVSALRESERRYRQLVELAPYGILIWDRKAIRFANTAAASILGVGGSAGGVPGGLEDQPLSRFLEGGDGLEARLATAAEGNGHRIDCTAVRPSGERRHLEIGATPAVYRREPAVLLVVNDVTDRKRVESELQRAQKMEAVGRMAGGIAHEFNNMLTAIGGFARLAERNPGDTGRVVTCVQEIAKASDRAAALTGQLLDFSHRRVAEEAELVALAPLVRDLRVFLKPLLSAGIDTAIDIRDEQAHALVNPVTLNQAVLNLALNARDAMPDGGRLTISLAVETPDAQFFSRHRELEHGRYAVIRVSDQGVGVPEAIRERVWEPFFTTKEPGKGTGLGLWMVYGTARQAGGAVEMESAPGEGSIFSILLPLAEPPVQAPGIEPLTVADGESATILLVDDESSVRTYLRLALEEAGCQVTEAADGVEALERFDAAGGLFDAVVSDVSMPRMNGPDLARAIAERNPAMPILFLTGYASKETAAGLTGQPGRRIAMKPVAPERLLEALRDLLAE